jgi:hypothetical protein
MRICATFGHRIGRLQPGRACVAAVLMWVTCAVPAAASNDGSIPRHDCVRPDRPAGDFGRPADGHERWERFADEVDAYRACISAFIQHNHDAATAHRAAANAATEEWNAFVRGSLNVPEHFPWPPRE